MPLLPSHRDPHVVSRGRLRLHSLGVPDDAIVLDGPWQFRHWTGPAPDDGWAEPASQRDGFGALTLPASWSVHGHGIPIYTNVQYPFDVARYPDVSLPDEGGDHVRVVDVPADWSGDRIVLRIGAAESAVEVFVDGVPAGFSTDSRLPAEFDVTDMVRPGSPVTLALRVHRWSASSWLEDQDMWWMAGIHRPVVLYRRPRVHVADMAVTTVSIAPDGAALVRVEVTAGGAVDQHLLADVRVDGHGATVPIDAAAVDGPADRNASGTVEVVVPDARLWSAEVPELVEVVVRLFPAVAGDAAGDAAGDPIDRHDELDCVTIATGLRTVAVSGGRLLVNGVPITIRGVNRHDHYPDGGRVVDEALLAEDIRLLKAHNFNAVRTAHYPHDERLYELCDRVGLYVVDEANLECHGLVRDLVSERLSDQLGPAPTDDAGFTEHFVERGARMVARDRNHPCVIVWSLGNEAGWGDNHRAMAEAIRALDRSRPVAYHPAESDPVVDVLGPMYPSVGDLREMAARADERPIVMCEYSHAMGNSNGGAADYDDVVDAELRLGGGFVWDWVDQGLPLEADDGTRYWAYGGDFGDEPNDANFNCNGLVDADRTPHPALAHFGWVHRPVVTSLATGDGSELEIRNRWSFLDTSHLIGRWTVRVDGDDVESGFIEVGPIGPGATAHVSIPTYTRSPRPRVRGEYRLLVEWHDQAGHRVAFDDLALAIGRPAGRPSPVARSSGAGEPGVEVDVASDRTVVEVGDTLFELDPIGVPQVLRLAGVDWVHPGGRLGITRALTDNDRALFGPEQAALRLREAGLLRTEPQPFDVAVRRAPTGVVEVGHRSTFGEPPHRLIVHVRWLFATDGSVAVDLVSQAGPSVPPLLRLGLELPLRTDVPVLSWYGPGPLESYPDRTGGQVVGRWSHGLDGANFAYARPQETGNHTAVRWAAVGDAAAGDAATGDGTTADATAGDATPGGATPGGATPGDGTPMLLAVGDPLFDTALRSFADGDIRRQRHPHEVEPSEHPWWRVDVAHSGLGTGSCGPGVAERHRVHPDHVRNRILFTAVPPATDPAAVARSLTTLRRRRSELH